MVGDADICLAQPLTLLTIRVMAAAGWYLLFFRHPGCMEPHEHRAPSNETPSAGTSANAIFYRHDPMLYATIRTIHTGRTGSATASTSFTTSDRYRTTARRPANNVAHESGVDGSKPVQGQNVLPPPQAVLAKPRRPRRPAPTKVPTGCLGWKKPNDTSSTLLRLVLRSHWFTVA